MIVDLAAASGGNCELTKADEVVTHHSVQIHGPTDLAARTAGDASEMYSRNVIALIDYLFGEDAHADEPEDEIAVGARITRGGEITDDRVRAALEEHS